MPAFLWRKIVYKLLSDWAVRKAAMALKTTRFKLQLSHLLNHQVNSSRIMWGTSTRRAGLQQRSWRLPRVRSLSWVHAGRTWSVQSAPPSPPASWSSWSQMTSDEVTFMKLTRELPWRQVSCPSQLRGRVSITWTQRDGSSAVSELVFKFGGSKLAFKPHLVVSLKNDMWHSSYSLGKTVFWRLGGKGWLNQGLLLINRPGVARAVQQPPL